MRSGWAVVTTQPNREAEASTRLDDQQVESYFPQFCRRRTSRVLPLFPGYLFLRNVANWRAVMNTRGVGMLVTKDGMALVPDHEISKIREREGQDGLVVLPDPLSPGARVQVRRRVVRSKWNIRLGPAALSQTQETLLGGVCDGMCGEDRVFVLLRFLGRVVRTAVRRDDLVPEADSVFA